MISWYAIHWYFLPIRSAFDAERPWYPMENRSKCPKRLVVHPRSNTRQRTYRWILRSSESSRLPVVLGGEHSITIGVVEAIADHFNDLSVLQLDAHADTRNSYHGSTHNHGCVMARVAEKCPIVQVGIRSLDGAEIRELDRSRVFWAHQIAAAATPAMSYSAIRPRMNASICGENPDGRPAQPVSKG